MKSDLYTQAVELLKCLIQIPSLSGEEEKTAELIESWFATRNVHTTRLANNVIARNLFFDESKPSILLNSHHDTVSPNKNYTLNPFAAIEEEGKLYGLGSNDAGGSLVSLMATFCHYYAFPNLEYNLVLAATAEEENSGDKGIRRVLPELPLIDFALVGEPTEMQLATSEKGLLVIDAYAKGISGHAAHDNTDNAIIKAMEDIQWINSYEFTKQSEQLGKVKASVTQIDAGTQHNVVPGKCHFVIDVRINDQYSNKEVFEILDRHTSSQLVARSFKHNSSSIGNEHPIVQSGMALGRTAYGSPTLSDQSALHCPSLKCGPGLSSRSHQANEFIYLHEIEAGIALYIKLFENILIKKEA